MKTNKNGFLGYNSIDLLTLNSKQTKKNQNLSILNVLKIYLMEKNGIETLA